MALSRTLCLPIALLASCTLLVSQQRQAKKMTDEEALSLAKAIHSRIIAIDTHDDISPDFASAKDDVGSPENKRQVSLPKMRKGGLGAEFFVVFVGQGPRTDSAYSAAYRTAIAYSDAIHRLPAMYPGEIDIAMSPADVERIHRDGKLVACIGMENGYAVGNDITKVKDLYGRGIRYITLTHIGHNQIGDSSIPGGEDKPEEHGGLSEFGKRLVAEMNRLGIMIDISHVSKKTAMDAMRLSKAPVIASHSGAFALDDSPRDLDDEALRALKENGGVVQVVALADYLKKRVDSPERTAAIAAVRKEFGIPREGGPAARAAFEKLTKEDAAKYREKMAAADRKFPRTPVTLQDMVNHIDYIVRLIGVDHVGIGSDFDGGGGITGYNGADDALNMTLELVKRGYTEEEIGKIWGRNLLRVWREVEGVAKNIQKSDKR